MDPEFATLVHASARGDARARKSLHEETYEVLLGAARGLTSLRGPPAPVDPASLVHEAWIKLAGAEVEPHEGEHLRALLCVGMRQILADRTRAAKAEKRGGAWRRITLSMDIEERRTIALPEMESLFSRLRAASERMERVAELKVFGKMTHGAIASELGVSVTTVEGDWRTAKALLRGWLAPRTERP